MQTTNLLAMRNAAKQTWDEHVQKCLDITNEIAKRLAPTSAGLAKPHFGFWTMKPDGSPLAWHDALNFPPTVAEGGNVTIGVEPIFDAGQHDSSYVVPLVFEFHPGDASRGTRNSIGWSVAGESAGSFQAGSTTDYDNAATLLNQEWTKRVKAHYALGAEPWKMHVGRVSDRG